MRTLWICPRTLPHCSHRQFGRVALKERAPPRPCRSRGIGAGLKLVAIIQCPTLWTFSNDKSLVVIDRQHIKISPGDIRIRQHRFS